ncbi:MAG: ATP-binding protein [Spirochaetales bacterium]|jgi:hypothetical protein|nr:ATP-binding protein [Spirochaetales bacterium]
MDNKTAQSKIYIPKSGELAIKMLIYGTAGAGKTTFGATAMDHEATAPVLFINAEGGMLSVVDKDPAAWDLNSYDELEEVFWFLAKGDHKYKTVVIDSLSELQMLNLDSIMKKNMQKTTGKNKREDQFDIWLEDYGKSTQQMRAMVRRFRDLPMHVIFTCLESSSMDDKKVESIHPALTPKLRGTALGYMDIVGYLYTKQEEKDGETETVRQMLVQPYEKWEAKDRSGKLGTTFNEPTVPKMMDIIAGKGGK